MRMDLWPQWLHEAVDATVAAQRAHAEVVSEATAEVENPERLAEALDLELRTSMRAITSAAFAVDAFYASVQARSPAHPHRERWRTPGRRRTPRQVQVFETLRYHLKVRRPGAAVMQGRIKQLFRFRGWAVHADSAYKDPIHRDDIDRGVDWHYAAFRAANAVECLFMAAQMLDVLVELLARGSEEIQKWAPFARARLDEVLDLYDAQPGLKPITRARDETGDGRANSDSPS